MQFTKAEEYGILGVLHLASKESGQVTPLSEVSEARDIPEKFLAKIFQSLSRSGVVQSHRGVRGGFSLTKAPEDISICEILESIQGPYHLMKCTANENTCEKSTACGLRSILVEAEECLLRTFQRHTLADLAKRELSQASQDAPTT
jgi:Rrf2 family protein